MGNSRFRSRCGRHVAASGVLSKACVENKGLSLAPQVGLEPTTLRLTAERLVAASAVPRCHTFAIYGRELFAMRQPMSSEFTIEPKTVQTKQKII